MLIRVYSWQQTRIEGREAARVVLAGIHARCSRDAAGPGLNADGGRKAVEGDGRLDFALECMGEFAGIHARAAPVRLDAKIDGSCRVTSACTSRAVSVSARAAA